MSVRPATTRGLPPRSVVPFAGLVIPVQIVGEYGASRKSSVDGFTNFGVASMFVAVPGAVIVALVPSSLAVA